MSGMEDWDRSLRTELAMRQLEGLTVTVEVPTESLGVNISALADMVARLVYGLVHSSLDIDRADRCDERLLNEGTARDTSGRKCLGVTRTGHHAHMVWEVFDSENSITLRARVRFVKVRRLIVEEEE